jgi:hypothetical protein
VRRSAETAEVEFEVKPKLAKLMPIHDGAFARARPRIFAEGEYFLDVDPGDPGAALLPRGSTIPGR